MNGENMDKLKYILTKQAPCFWCGYNGSGFFQKRTHEKWCPWYCVSGGEERADLVLEAIRSIWGCAKQFRAGYPNRKGTFNIRSLKKLEPDFMEDENGFI